MATPPNAKTAPEVQRQRLLNRVAALYHQSFEEDPKGRDYLAQVGLKETSVLDGFQTGWVNGSLLATIPEESELTGTLEGPGAHGRTGPGSVGGLRGVPVVCRDGRLRGTVRPQGRKR